MSIYEVLPDFFKVAGNSFGVSLVHLAMFPIFLSFLCVLLLFFSAMRLSNGTASKEGNRLKLVLLFGSSFCALAFVLLWFGMLYSTYGVVLMLGFALFLLGTSIIALGALFYMDAAQPESTSSQSV